MFTYIFAYIYIYLHDAPTCACVVRLVCETPETPRRVCMCGAPGVSIYPPAARNCMLCCSNDSRNMFTMAYKIYTYTYTYIYIDYQIDFLYIYAYTCINIYI